MNRMPHFTSVSALLVLGAFLLAACGGAPPQTAETSPTTVPASLPTVESTPAPAEQPTAAPSPEPAAAAPQSLRVAILRDEGALQPYTYVTGYPGWNMLSLVYDALFVMDEQNLPVPWLATEDAVSDDGLVHTITLREGVTWHDGQLLTSDDVKFSYEYYQENTHSRWTGQVSGISSIETPDPTTVILTLEQANPGFAIQPLADVPIIPKHLWEGVTEPDTFANNIGSGPFKLAEYRPDQLYRFTANEGHFGGPPAVGELLMPVIKDQTTIFSALRTGEINGTTVALTPELVQEFQNAPNLGVQTGPGYATTMLMVNTERAPWDKVEVHRAVALAIDPQMLVDTVLLGYGAPGNPGWLHPSSPFHDPAITGTTDLAQAQQLLDGLGYTDSDGDGVREAEGQPMVAELLVQSNAPLRVRAAELIAAALKELGITINVTALEPDSVTAKVWPDFDVAKGRDFDLSMWAGRRRSSSARHGWLSSRPAQRHAADRHGFHAQPGLRGQRGDGGRDRVFVPWGGAAHFRGGAEPRLSGDPGRLSDDHRAGDPREYPDRCPLGRVSGIWARPARIIRSYVLTLARPRRGHQPQGAAAERPVQA